MPQLGNVFWGQGRFSYEHGPRSWLLRGSDDKNVTKNIPLILKNDEGSPLLILDLLINNTYVLQGVLNQIKDFKNLEFGSFRTGTNSFVGKVVAKPPFEPESIRSLMKAAAVIGPRR